MSARRTRRFWRDDSGAAAAEFVLWLSLLTLPLINAVDLGVYVFKKMQVETAAQAGTHAVWRSCDTSAKLPAVSNCTGLAATIQAAVQSTSLGATVTVASGSPVEGYYCLNSSGALTLVGTAGTLGSAPTRPSPFTCAGQFSGSTTAPGDYVQVTVSYPYEPIFSQASVASLLTTPITKTAWMRLN
ncbi:MULTISPECIES: TadE/TadG family type IV pilus assembly protein [unclassified Phenylobacterium]|uniref:TadE/TadG family type IV pilus assembly protein n=1 Tax=unclassified Phenylobacterium TaxID=2640670 RepID=UPI0022B4E435|nr:TadE/TadG family type IV pilus assembly protein [Phenylobacterium sp. NIBR 498073]MBS0490731.1 pilus assembly protein [Pseudomonadota bacterium]WGU41783.1 TadE/TadG family type IV pilus assembly protein [Phenylobacterium sp. NIBR 498073]